MSEYAVVERVGDRIHLTTPHRQFGHPAFREDVARCKRVAGGRWAPGAKVWTYPLNMATCHDLRATWGAELEIGPALAAWAREQRAMEDATRPMLDPTASVTLKHLPGVAPTLHAAVTLGRPYQAPAVAFGVAWGAYINGDQPGLGKTLDALAVLLERHPMGGDHLILAPLTSIRNVWAREIARWLEDAPGGYSVHVAAPHRKARLEAIADWRASRDSFDRPVHRFLLCNVEMMRTKEESSTYCGCGEEDCYDIGIANGHELKTAKWYTHEYPELFAERWTSLTVDEAHKALIRGRGKALSQTRRGAEFLQTVEDGTRQALTGTPFKGKTVNLWGTLNWLRPAEYTSFWTWVNQWLATEDDGYGMRIGDVRDDRRAAFYRSLDTILIRRTKDELRKINPDWAPPPKTYITIHCEMVGKQKTAYEAMAKNASVTLGDAQLTANGILAEMTRLKQFAHAYGKLVPGREGMEFVPDFPSGKFERVLEMLDERGISGDEDEQGGTGKVVIGSQFTAMINLYAAELRRRGIAHHMLTGETPIGQRDDIQQDWQFNPNGPRVLLINTLVGGVSITLDAADEMFVLDETWVPDDQEQLEDRLHRTSRTDHYVTIYHFITDGTIEEDINAICEGKDATQRQHLDGRRGVEFAKQWKAAGITAKRRAG